MKNNQNHGSVLIDGQSFAITPQMYNSMKYFAQAEALEAVESGHITHHITAFDISVWNQLLHMLQTFKYQLPIIPPTIQQNDPRDLFGTKLSIMLQKMSPKQLNSLYKGAHFLKIESLKRCIAALLSSLVVMRLTKEDYQTRKKKLGVKNDLTYQLISQYKQRYPFIN